MMTLLLLMLSLAGLGQQADPAALGVTHRARAVAPGEMVRVSVAASVPLKTVSAFAKGFGATGSAIAKGFGASDYAILFYRLDTEHWEGLVPIDVEARAGQRILTVRAIAADGRELTREYPLTIATRSFPARRITVAPQFVDPPADALPRIEKERHTVEGLFAVATPERFWTESFIVPVPGQATSSFGRRSIVNGQPRSPHTGTDFQAATGTPVVAPNRGRVVLAADLYFSGNTIIVDHGLGVYSYLAHLSAFEVTEGTMVKRGQEIARSGATGRVTGPHLHWTLRVGAARVDPLSLLAVFAPPSATDKPLLPRKPR